MQVEALLKDRAWLKGLARSLVRDDAAAEDLVQDGWLAAIRTPPTRHVRAWWRSVLKRRAIDLRREAERRRAREEQVAAPEAPSEELLERVELQEQVARAVRELPEPYRGVILLRYFDGLEPRAIAKRLAVPVETVRTRLKRAHAMLRDRLSDRRDALLLLALPGAIPKLIGGMVTMAHTKKVSILALVLFSLSLSLFFTWRGLRGHEPAPRASATARDPAASAAVPEEPAAMAEEPWTGWSIGIRTVTKDGTPVPRVEVEGRAFENGAAAGEQTLTTDAIGGAAWRLPAFDGTVRLEVCARSADYPESRREVLVAAGREPPATIELKLRARDGRIEGRVLDARGKPIPGAVVETNGSRATAGADGRYSLGVPSEYKEPFVWAHAEGYAFERVAVVLRDGRGTADLRLRDEFRIKGRVTDEEGRPVRGAVIRTFFTGYYQHAVSDRDGRYVLAHLDPGRDQHMLEAGHPAYAAFAEMVPTSGREANVDIVLKRGLPLEGRVEGPDGAPVSSASVAFYTLHDPVDFGALDAESSADGTFSFGTRLPPGEHEVTVDHKSFAPFARKITIPSEGPLVVRLEAPHHVAGTVVDDLGRPIEIWLAATTADAHVSRRAKSDAQGRWRIEGVPDGPVEIELFGPGFVRTKVASDADRDDVRITVQRAGLCKGRVVDDATGKPVTSFTLRVTSATGSSGLDATWVREGFKFEDPEGRWTIDEEFQVGGAAGVQVQADGYAPAYGTATAAIDADPDACVVRMTRGLTIEGVVIDDETGRPLMGAVVRLDPEAAGSYAAEETHQRRMQRTGGDGKFRFPAAEPGLALTVEHPDRAPFVQRDVGAEPLTVRLQAGCVVEGTASPGDEVTLVGDGKSRDAVADAKGRFRFDRLPEGRYQLAKRARLEQPPYTWFAYPVVRNVEATRGRPIDVELKPLGTATVRGTIGGSKEIAGAVVYLAREGEQVARSVFLHERAFEFTGVEAGRYRLILPGSDPRGPGTEFDLKDGETREVTLKPQD